MCNSVSCFLFKSGFLRGYLFGFTLSYSLSVTYYSVITINYSVTTVGLIYAVIKMK